MLWIAGLMIFIIVTLSIIAAVDKHKEEKEKEEFREGIRKADWNKTDDEARKEEIQKEETYRYVVDRVKGIVIRYVIMALIIGFIFALIIGIFLMQDMIFA